MKRLGTAVFILLNCYSFGQVGNENVSYSTGTFFMRANKSVNHDVPIDGKPYVDGDRFYKVAIKNYSKDVQELRYNAYLDEMEFRNDNDLYFANKENHLKINFLDLNKTYECLQYTIDGKTNFGYLVVLVDDPKYSLYKKEKIELLKGEKSTNAYTKDANDYYAKQRDTYLIAKNQQFFKFPKNLSDIATLLSVNKKELEAYIKTNKLNINKEEGMIKLLQFVNQY